jgi:hypothetical protein
MGSVAVQSTVGAFASYLAWMWMLGHYPATKISAFVFLTPLFALLFGMLWLGEAVTLTLILSLTLTYAAALPAGDLDVRTRRIRQGGSVGVWEVELRPPGSEEVGVHAIVTTAKRPDTPPFAFVTMPDAPDPDSLPAPEVTHARQHFGSTVLERRTLDGFPPKPSAGSRSLAWVRSRREPLDRALLGMITDNSPPRAMYAFGMGVSTTTLSLTVYLHATEAEVAEVGNGVECGMAFQGFQDIQEGDIIECFTIEEVKRSL